MSAAQRRGLGKGLGALLGDAPMPTSPSATDGVRELGLDRIVPNAAQPRKRFDDAATEELKVSIAQHGVLVPIIVRPRGERYEIVAGERRWRACAALGRATIPVIVRAADDALAYEVAIVENLQREDLNPIEEAMGFAHLIGEYALSQDDLAKHVGKSRPSIANALRLLALDDECKAMLADGRLSAGHARALLAFEPTRRRSISARIVAEGLSVRAVERLSALPEPPRAAPPRKPLSADERDFEQRLRERFGVRVEFRRRGRGGIVQFRCTNEAELLALGDALLEGKR